MLATNRKGKLQTAVLRFYNYDTKNNSTSIGDRCIFFIARRSNNLRLVKGDRTTALAKKTPKLFQGKHFQVARQPNPMRSRIIAAKFLAQMLVPELSMGILSMGNYL